MAIEFTSELLAYSNNKSYNSQGTPRALLGNITYEPTPDGNPNGKVINLGQNDGLYYGDLTVSNNPTGPSPSANVLVSDQVDYEISFWFYQPHNYPSLQMTGAAFTEYMYPLSMYDIQNNTPNSYWFRYNDNICGNSFAWNFARYILYSCNAFTLEKGYFNAQPKTSLGVGTNLVMAANTKFVNVKLINFSPAVKIFNLAIKPARTPYSTGFVQGGNMLQVWRKVNNTALNIELLDRIVKQKLIPYNIGHAPINI